MYMVSGFTRRFLKSCKAAATGFVIVASVGIAAVQPAAAQETQFDYLVDIDDIVNGIPYDPSPAGTVVRVAVTVSNDSTVAAPATQLTFDVPNPPAAPGSITLVGTSGDITNCLPAGYPVAGGTTITCDVPLIPGRATFNDPANSAQVVLDFQTTVEAAMVVVATVPFVPGAESNEGNNTLSETVTVAEGVDLDVDISTPSTTLASGEIFNW